MAKPPDAFLSYTRFDDQTWRRDQRVSPMAQRHRARGQRRAVRDLPGRRRHRRWRALVGQIGPNSRPGALLHSDPDARATSRARPAAKSCRSSWRPRSGVGRKDLIIPIYYIQSAVLEDKAMRAADHLATVLARTSAFGLASSAPLLVQKPQGSPGDRRTCREIDHARRRKASATARPSGANDRTVEQDVRLQTLQSRQLPARCSATSRRPGARRWWSSRRASS